MSQNVSMHYGKGGFLSISRKSHLGACAKCEDVKRVCGVEGSVASSKELLKPKQNRNVFQFQKVSVSSEIDGISFWTMRSDRWISFACARAEFNHRSQSRHYFKSLQETYSIVESCQASSKRARPIVRHHAFKVSKANGEGNQTGRKTSQQNRRQCVSLFSYAQQNFVFFDEVWNNTFFRPQVHIIIFSWHHDVSPWSLMAHFKILVLVEVTFGC